MVTFENNIAWLFPGQASQKVGMGFDLYENTEVGLDLFQKANHIMGYDIQKIIFKGPDETLLQTQHTQPAIYIVSVILGTLLLEKGFTPSVVAGHSLGEYSALTISGSIDFETGLNLVKIRSESMAAAGEQKKGSMSAIVGLKGNLITEICKSYKGAGLVVVANFNSPQQIVISGDTKAIDWAMKIAKESGAKICIKLNVSGAFHSPLMRPAREDLSNALEKAHFSNANYPLFTNVKAKPLTDKTKIKECLIKQLENPVLWSDIIIAINNLGIQSFFEVGPGKVLQGLNKRINRKLKTIGFGTFQELKDLNV